MYPKLQSVAWLRYCIDPLGPRGDPPRSHLSPRQARRFFLKAEAHHVLPTVLQNFPFPERSGLSAVLEEAEWWRIERLALTTMLNYHAERILAAEKSVPVVIVKGRSFARNIYPDPALRPFTDIDLLVRPDAIPQLNSVLLSQGFTVSEALHPEKLETKWAHCKTGALVEVHHNLVQHPRMRRAFSLTYEDLEGNEQTPAAFLTVAVTHGAMHYFALLRHIVDICQAARLVTAPAEETRFGALIHRTGTRFAAIVGLTLAHRIMGETRCLEIAKALGSIRHASVAQFLAWGADRTATSNNWLLYNTWRRYLCRELISYGGL